MASFFQLILDTLAPQGFRISLNGGAQYTTGRDVTLNVTVSDSDISGYQIKIWGIDGVADESAAVWQTLTENIPISLPAGDGTKTVYAKIRDDVRNETAAASASITLNTAVPVVTVTGPDVSKISKVNGCRTASVSFTVDVDFTEYKVCVVTNTNSIESAGTVIGTANGSTNTSGTGTFKAGTPINVTIDGADLEAASEGDGVKIIKVFAKNSAGTWSVA